MLFKFQIKDNIKIWIKSYFACLQILTIINNIFTSVLNLISSYQNMTKNTIYLLNVFKIVHKTKKIDS